MAGISIYILCLTLIYLLSFHESKLLFFKNLFVIRPFPIEGDIARVEDEELPEDSNA